MPAERLSMRRVREVLRLRHACGASVRTIARSVGVGHTIGITWPVPAEIDDAELERRLFTPAGFYKAPRGAGSDPCRKAHGCGRRPRYQRKRRSQRSRPGLGGS